jgi:hypothetical protein
MNTSSCDAPEAAAWTGVFHSITPRDPCTGPSRGLPSAEVQVDGMETGSDFGYITQGPDDLTLRLGLQLLWPHLIFSTVLPSRPVLCLAASLQSIRLCNARPFFFVFFLLAGPSLDYVL